MAESGPVDMAFLKRKYKNVQEDDGQLKEDFYYKELGAFHVPKNTSGYCSANSKYVFYHLRNSGLLLQANSPGRFNTAQKLASGKVHFSQWCPYNDALLATAGDKGSVKIFNADGMEFITETTSSEAVKGSLVKQEHPVEPVQTLKCPTEKLVNVVQWNPVVGNLLLAVSKDKSGTNMFVFDISSGQELYAFEAGFEVFDAIWSGDGNKIIYTKKEMKKDNLFVLDVLTGTKTQCSCGMKSGHLFYASLKMYGNARDYIGVSGTNEDRVAAFSFYDADTLELAHTTKLAGSERPLLPYFDNGRAMLWCYGKTESRIYFYRFFVLDGDINWKKSPKNPGTIVMKASVSGACFIGQRGLDYNNLEIQRMYALDAEKKRCIVYKMIVPLKRKGEFNKMYYPEAPGEIATLDLATWQENAGKTTYPTLWDLDPSITRDATGKASFTVKATYQELEAKLAALTKLCETDGMLTAEGLTAYQALSE